MGSLLLVLGSIGLVDSTSMLPLAIPILIAFLAGEEGYVRCAAFLVGILLVYFPAGLLIALGLDALLERVAGALEEVWLNPSQLHLAFQILISGLMVALGARMASRREGGGDRGASEPMSPGAALSFGAGLMVVGLPGAFPYFAAVDQIVRSETSVPGATLLLVYYNAVFLAPLAAVPALRWLLGARADALFARLASWLERWGRRVVMAALIGVGVVGVLDGIGWFLGHPLLPVPPAVN